MNAVGAERVGLRLSPYSWEFLNAREPDVESTIKLNVHLLEQLNKHGLLYVHIVASRAEGRQLPHLLRLNGPLCSSL